MVKSDVGGDPMEGTETVKPSLCGIMPLVGDSSLTHFYCCFSFSQLGLKGTRMPHWMMFARCKQEWGLTFTSDIFHTVILFNLFSVFMN